MFFEVDIPDPAAAQAHQRVPIAGKRQLEDHAQHSVVVILDLSLEPLSALQNQLFGRRDHWGSLVPNVGRSGVLEVGLLQRARAKKLPQLVKTNFLANVELDEDENRAVQRRLDRSRSHAGA